MATLQQRIIDLAEAVGADIKTLFESLTLDSVPTDNSTNGVESGGVFDALALKADKVRPVVDKPAGYTIPASESGTIFTNAGASDLVDFFLPTTGLIAGETQFGFTERSTFGMNIFTVNSDVVGVFGTDSANGVGNANNPYVNGFIDLLFIGDGVWLAIANINGVFESN